jgi:TPP-dependent pyruvate/acetoin dehydrogenase alpha subunit
MSIAHPVQPHPSSAVQRTELLHRMLLVRHLTKHHAAAPGTASGDFQVHFHAGEEAVAAGVLAALGPSDTIVSTDPDPALATGFPLAIELARDDVQSHRPGVTVCLFEASGDPVAPWLDVARQGKLPILFCGMTGSHPETAGQESFPDETADSFDVEAVLSATHTSLRKVRDSGGPRLLGLGGNHRAPRPDPIEVLVLRMVTDHQLDDNALRAIDSHAAGHVEAALAAASS